MAQATGAYTTTSVAVSPPSFVLMDVQGSKVVTYSYVLDGEVSSDAFFLSLARGTRSDGTMGRW